MTPYLVLCALLGAAAAPEPAPAPLPIRRFALVAGVNDGGSERVPLRYARSDAERIARVLERMGGIAPADEILLLDADDAALRAAFRAIEGRIRAARATHRAELVLYYSGHADEQGLLLRGTHLPFQEVRRWLDSVGAQVRIAIVDSCSSGALTRQKGGQQAPPFLVDTSAAVKGHAILTSSAANESSQESDRIGASFFTHYLVTGLRGAADTNLDGKVTVNEAYQFAFAETLARTERTRSGAQHPAYDIQLAGSGDVVVTDLRGTDATLVFPGAAAGRFFVRDREGRLVAELRKLAGQQVELGVESGAYRIVRDDGERLAEAQLAIASGGRVTMPVEGLTKVAREAAAVRGGELARVPVDISIFPPHSTNGDRATTNAFQLGLFGARTTRLHGFGLAPVLWAEEDVVGAQLGGLWASAGLLIDGAQVSGIVGLAGALRGVQLAGIAADVRGHVTGTQVTGIGGLAGSLRGVQLAGLGADVRGHLEGLQITGIGGRAASLHGVQLAGLGADVRGHLEGGQVAGLAGRVASLTGVQLSGLVNLVRGDAVGLQLGGIASWAGGRARGLQLSPITNVAGWVEGIQLATVNVADELRGLQLGLVNVSTGSVRGSQFGLVNVSRQVDGVPLGLVNVVRDGWHRLLLVSDEDGTPSVGWAGGGGLFHTTLEASLRRNADGGRAWAAFGPGVHLVRERLGVDVDLLAGHALPAGLALDDGEAYTVVTLRALAAVALSQRFALVAGPTVNVLLDGRGASVPPVGGAFGDLASSGDGARAWVGLQAGVRL